MDREYMKRHDIFDPEEAVEFVEKYRTWLSRNDLEEKTHLDMLWNYWRREMAQRANKMVNLIFWKGSNEERVVCETSWEGKCRWDRVDKIKNWQRENSFNYQTEPNIETLAGAITSGYELLKELDVVDYRHSLTGRV